jgi:hypothetical protein
MNNLRKTQRLMQSEIDKELESLRNIGNEIIAEDIAEMPFSFFIGNDRLSVKVTRLGYGDQRISRGNISDGYSTLHYELSDDSLVKLKLEDSIKPIEWESILKKGSYRITLSGDRLARGVIDRLTLSEKSVS